MTGREILSAIERGGGRFGGPLRWRRKSIDRQDPPLTATQKRGVLCEEVAVYDAGVPGSDVVEEVY